MMDVGREESRSRIWSREREVWSGTLHVEGKGELDSVSQTLNAGDD
jgi:hypothetical protein